MPERRSSGSSSGRDVFVNPLPSRWSASTAPSISSKSSQPFAFGTAAGRRPSIAVSSSRRGSFASASPSQLSVVAEDAGASVGAAPPSVPFLPLPARLVRPGTFGLLRRDLTLVEAALSGDMAGARVALARGELPGKRDAEGRDAVLGSLCGWPVLKHFNKTITVRSNNPKQPDPLSLFLEILPNPSVTLWTLNATYSVVQTGTLLTVACWLEKVEYVRALLGEAIEEGGLPDLNLRGWVDSDHPDARGGTGLMYSAVAGQLEIAQLLLRHGARPDRTENSGLSAIWHATGRPQMTWLLEDALRKIRAKEHSMETDPFHTATRLLSLDAGLHPSTNFAHAKPPPISFFESQQHEVYAKTLLRAIRANDVVSLENLLFPAPPAFSRASTPTGGATDQHDTAPSGVAGLVNFVDESGFSPLHHALRVQPTPSPDVIKLLFAAGADLNIACTSRSTPLHHLACLGGASPEETRRTFASRQASEESMSSNRSRTPTSDAISSSSSKRTASQVKTSTEHKAPFAMIGGLPTPVKELSGPSTPAASSKTSVSISKDDERLRPDIAGAEIEAQLKDVVELVLRLGAIADLRDCAGALPLHFAAEGRPIPLSFRGLTLIFKHDDLQYGSSREIVRALLLDDVDKEEEFLRARLELPHTSPERVSARNRQNDLGVTPRDVCRVEFVDLFDMAEQESKSRKKRILEEYGHGEGHKASAAEENAPSRGTAYGSSGSLSQTAMRDSILQPLAQITSLEEAAHNLEQVTDNLMHVDKSLSSGLLQRVKEDLARQNSTHPEPELFHTPLGDPVSEGLARLRRSFQTSSTRNSSNRLRPISLNSIQSSWYSQPSSCYDVDIIMAVRSELDSLYRLFTNTAHMVARVLQFYQDTLVEEDKKLVVVEQYAERSRAGLSETEDAIKHLFRRQQNLRMRMEELETDRHNQSILSQVTDLAVAVGAAMSSQVQGAMREGAEDLDLVRHIKAAAVEAVKDLEQMKADIADINTSVAADAMRIVDDHVAKVHALCSDLVRQAIVQQQQIIDKRMSFNASAISASAHARPSPTSSTPSSPTFSTFATPSSSNSRLTSETTPSRASRAGLDSISEAQGVGLPSRKPLSEWLLAASPNKEEREEFVVASSNLQEIEKDILGVEADMRAAEENEVLIQAFIDQHPRRAKTLQEAYERREAFRLMTVVFQQLDRLRQEWARLSKERAGTVKVLERLAAEEAQQDRLDKLSSLLRSHAVARPAPSVPRVTKFNLVETQHSEEVTFAPFDHGSQPRWDEKHAQEADVAWELKKLELKMEGAEALQARMTEDHRLILKAMLQNRMRCTTADRHVRDSQSKLSRYLQWRMDSIVVLWEYISSEADDERSSLSNASSWILDSRDRLLLPDLITDPLPLPSSFASGGGGGGGSSSFSHATESVQTPPYSPEAPAAPASALPTADADPAGGALELTMVKQVLKVKVHEPLKAARAEVEKAVEWCRILQGARERLDGRLQARG